MIFISMWVGLMLSRMIIFFCAKCITFRASLITCMNQWITDMRAYMLNLHMVDVKLTLFFNIILFVNYIRKWSNTIFPYFPLLCIANMTNSFLLTLSPTLMLLLWTYVAFMLFVMLLMATILTFLSFIKIMITKITFLVTINFITLMNLMEVGKIFIAPTLTKSTLLITLMLN